MSPAFDRYIGIDYPGAETPTSSLKGLRVYMADRASLPSEVLPPPSARKHWTRRGIAEWLVERLAEDAATLVGIDHGFSFPLRYFEEHRLKPTGQPFSTTSSIIGRPSTIGISGAPTLLCCAEGNTVGSDNRELPEGSTRSETLRMRRSPSHRNWEVSSAPEIGQWPKGVLGKAHGRNPKNQPDEKSDACIVPRNDPNNGDGSTPPSAGDQEGRRAAKRNAGHPPAPRTQSRTGASMGLDRVREAARKGRDVRFTALMHHITPDLLAESFMDLKRSAAAGVDGVTWREYENGLDDRIAALWEAVQSGRYRAQPSRWVYIPKVDGSQRPLGVAALEDKIVQQAVVTVLTAIYEADFLLWIPARAQPASSVGRSLGRAQPEESELGARRRHQVVLGSCLILPSTL